MKTIVFACALMFSTAAAAVEWNNPFVGICTGEYRVITTLGLGDARLQINDDRDAFGYASVGITPAVGVWQVELRYSNFDDNQVDVDQYGVNFKVDFSLTCDVQCLYWMVGWNYGDFDIGTVERHDTLIVVNDSGDDNYWNAGVGYRYNWTRDFDTSLEYNYNDVGRVVDVDLGHLRSLTLNFAYRF
ncbi:outer membrane beta-barrel protein [Microbulbifer marinus]|uniref:Opacity protein n=1 Tax=Microbulbifer marinus TaxID=658218 RepID=A0A1H3YS20_9GAMM|nr:outer membrane beta-barrel protein [Microbulbifer marinus]SEA14240.1 Opacity protein [Microbulbifer marinus]